MDSLGIAASIFSGLTGVPGLDTLASLFSSSVQSNPISPFGSFGTAIPFVDPYQMMVDNQNFVNQMLQASLGPYYQPDYFTNPYAELYSQMPPSPAYYQPQYTTHPNGLPYGYPATVYSPGSSSQHVHSPRPIHGATNQTLGYGKSRPASDKLGIFFKGLFRKRSGSSRSISTGESTGARSGSGSSSNRSMKRDVTVTTFSRPESMLQLIQQQKPYASGSEADSSLGMSTGGLGERYFDYGRAIQHWNSFTTVGHNVRGDESAIAVLDWTEGAVTMYVRLGFKYYRSYRVCPVDEESFASVFKDSEVCSGIIGNQQLKAINKPMSLVLDRGQLSGLQSSNCWYLLGVPRPQDEKGRVFLQLPRGAIFGIINCLYEFPHLLNVVMKRLPSRAQDLAMDYVKIESNADAYTVAWRRESKSDCAFSVFEFGTKGWAGDKVMVG